MTSGPIGETRAKGRDPETGRFIVGNAAALVHGRRAEGHQAALVESARAELAPIRDEIASELGGDLARLKSDLLDHYVAAAALLRWMEDRLLADGVVTSKGRRRALHGAYIAQLDRVTRLAVELGLERRKRPEKGIADWAAEHETESAA